MRLICGVVLLAILFPAFAQTGSAIEWTQSGDRLSNGGANWHSEELRLSRQIAPKNSIDGTFRHVSRFGLADTQLEINYAAPLSARLTGAVTASGSTSHRFLPKSDLGASLQYEIAPTWLVHAGAGATGYEKANVAKAMLGIEHYFSAFRAAVGWRLARADGVPANGADIRLDYYYDDLDFIGLQAASGREAANIDGRGVIVSSVRSAGLIGRHGLTRHWMLRYGVERVKQGDFYNRTGVRLGVQYAF
ncbi:MAG: YaiO family outer membrane beta-barrel protein [Betaproteobacteria bacterium]|nr:YaiO family outer membrane beta-barrel protein [Betaproteobacteria bacterium]